METLVWFAAALLMLTGLVGTVVPGVPGVGIILAGAVVHRVWMPPGQTVSWWVIAGLAALTALAYAVDWGAAWLGAKRFGASKWGAAGGCLGGIAGAFFLPLGLFAGPVIGALTAELLFARRALGEAARASWGTLLGTILGIFGKFVLGAAMVAWFVSALLW